MAGWETEVLIREAIAKDLIDFEIPRHCVNDGQDQIIKEVRNTLKDAKAVNAIDVEAEAIIWLEDHPRMKQIGATRYDIIVWWTKLKVSGRFWNEDLDSGSQSRSV